MRVDSARGIHAQTHSAGKILPATALVLGSKGTRCARVLVTGFNMDLLERFNEEGIEFAFPTQTLYVKQDSPIEADVHVVPTGGGPSA